MKHKREGERIWKKRGKGMPIGEVQRKRGQDMRDESIKKKLLFPKRLSGDFIAYASRPYEGIL
jgi:hypothetical protein